MGVQVVGNYAYVANANAGLQILELRLGYPQTLSLQLPAEVQFQGLPIASVGVASSGLPFTLSVISGPASIVNNQLVLTGLGPVTLHAEQAGNDSFLAVSAQWTMTVVHREPLPSVSIAPVSTGVRLRFTGIPGRSYTIERAFAVTGPWNAIDTQTALAVGLIEYLETNSPVGAAFYRTRSP